MATLILASGSPQRKEILLKMGIPFRAVPSVVDEHHDGLEKPHAIVRNIALRKANAVALMESSSWVLGSDTIVVLSNGAIALKPVDRADAERTLRLYRNSYCDVYSGLALVNRDLKIAKAGFEKTRIRFKDFPSTEIEAYLETGDWQGCSGSLTIEGVGERWIESVKGDYWNVVGLPVHLLGRYLTEISWETPWKIPSIEGNLSKFGT